MLSAVRFVVGDQGKQAVSGERMQNSKIPSFLLPHWLRQEGSNSAAKDEGGDESHHWPYFAKPPARRTREGGIFLAVPSLGREGRDRGRGFLSVCAELEI